MNVSPEKRRLMREQLSRPFTSLSAPLGPPEPPPNLEIMLRILPFELQRLVASHLSVRTLKLLAMANRHCNDIVTPLLYQHLDFSRDLDYGTLGRKLRTDRQTRLITSVKEHPELGHWVRSMIWSWVPHSWELFPLLPNVRDFDFLSHADIRGPSPVIPSSVFPALETAKLSGIFHLGSLESILLGSPDLMALHFYDSVVISGESNPAQALQSVIQRFVDEHSFPKLRSLKLERFESGVTRTNRDESLLPFESFMHHYSPQLQELSISSKEDPKGYAFMTYIFPSLVAGTHKNLRLLVLRGFELSKETIELLKAQLLQPAKVKEQRPIGYRFFHTPE